MQAPQIAIHPKRKRDQPWRKPVVCIECGGRAKETNGKTIYPHRPDLWRMRFWQCQCGAYVGCHPKSNHPLGYPCNLATRRARQVAHDAFDPLWKNKRTGRFSHRNKAYQWLAARMGLSKENCHIGMFTEAQAREVVRHCRELLTNA